MLASLSSTGAITLDIDLSKPHTSLQATSNFLAVSSRHRCWTCAILPKAKAKLWRQRRDCTAGQADWAEDKPAALSGVESQGSDHAELQAYHLMQERLNFKYPRSRKLLLVMWSMSHLRHSTKSFVATEALFSRYGADLSAAKRVPQADFEEELIKALALLDISSGHSQSGNQQGLKGIALAEGSSTVTETPKGGDKAAKRRGQRS